MNYLTKNETDIIELIEQYGSIDGGWHKQWVLDQIVRVIMKEDYDSWVAIQYDWDEGTAP